MYREGNRLTVAAPRAGSGCDLFGLFFGSDFLLLFAFGFGQSLHECGERRASVHAASLMRTPGIVADEIVVENLLHLLDRLEPGLAAFDAEVLVATGSGDRIRNTRKAPTATSVVRSRLNRAAFAIRMRIAYPVA